MDLGLDTAQLFGISAESVLYGVYLILFPVTIHVLLNRRRDQHGISRSHKILLAGGCLLFCLVTTNWILNLVRLYLGFIKTQHTPAGAIMFFGLISDPRNITRNVMFVFQVVIVDILLLYRLYMVWNRDWRILVLPALGLLGTIITGILETIGLINAPPYESLWVLAVSKYIVAGCACSLGTNLLAVILISGRILYYNGQVRRLGATGLSSVILILIESAGVNCVLTLMVMVSMIMKSSFSAGVFYAASPAAGISFCLITLRVGLSEWFDRFTKTSTVSARSTSRRSRREDGSIPMVVHVRHEQETSSSNGVSYKEDSSGMRDTPDTEFSV